MALIIQMMVLKQINVMSRSKKCLFGNSLYKILWITSSKAIESGKDPWSLD